MRFQEKVPSCGTCFLWWFAHFSIFQRRLIFLAKHLLSDGPLQNYWVWLDRALFALNMVSKLHCFLKNLRYTYAAVKGD